MNDRQPISNEQAEVIGTTLDALMRVDIGMRTDMIDFVNPDEVTKAIINIVDVFSYCNDELDSVLDETGIRTMVRAKKEMIERSATVERFN